jgi:hypothetical protein
MSHAEVLDVKGAFLHGFEDGEQIYMGITEGPEQHYGAFTTYVVVEDFNGSSRAAARILKQLLMAFKSM